MTKNFRVTVLICASIALAATISLYLFTFDNVFSVPMRWVSLLFLIIAEIIGTCKALFIKKTIFGVANMTTSLIHIGLVLIISIIFVNAFPYLLKTYILLNFLMLCFLAIADVIVIHTGGHIASSNSKLHESQAVIDTCYSKAQSLCVEHGDGDYKKDLFEIAEMIKYSDNSVLTDDEMPILDRLDELQGLLAGNEPSVQDKITEIKNLIKLRSIKVKSQKRGSY